jgi:hypothetical protein
MDAEEELGHLADDERIFTDRSCARVSILAESAGSKSEWQDEARVGTSTAPTIFRIGSSREHF